MRSVWPGAQRLPGYGDIELRHALKMALQVRLGLGVRVRRADPEHGSIPLGSEIPGERSKP